MTFRLSSRMGFAAVAMLALVALLSACALGPDGSRCGGAQSAFARATLPDTGLAFGATAQFGMSQRDPFLIGEQTDIDLQVFKLFAAAEPPAGAIRLRVVLDDGYVALDSTATRTTGTVAWGWSIRSVSTSAAVRERLFAAIRNNAVTVEFWAPNASTRSTSVRPQVIESGVSPILTCV